MNNRIFREIEAIILEAMEKTEAAIKDAEMHEACCESEMYEAEAHVMEAEATCRVNDTPQAMTALDNAYRLIDETCEAYNKAHDDTKALHAIYEALERITWDC